MTPEERAKKLMAKLLLRNDDGSWAGRFPTAKEDVENQHRIITEAFREAIEEERKNVDWPFAEPQKPGHAGYVDNEGRLQQVKISGDKNANTESNGNPKAKEAAI